MLFKFKNNDELIEKKLKIKEFYLLLVLTVPPSVTWQEPLQHKPQTNPGFNICVVEFIHSIVRHTHLSDSVAEGISRSDSCCGLSTAYVKTWADSPVPTFLSQCNILRQTSIGQSHLRGYIIVTTNTLLEIFCISLIKYPFVGSGDLKNNVIKSMKK